MDGSDGASFWKLLIFGTLESIEELLESIEELCDSIEDLLESIEELLESIIKELIECNYHKNHVGEIYGLIWAFFYSKFIEDLLTDLQ